ncbi:uncharacterized protein LOC112876760 [Panicum hallii]|uniref:uncharacterized protein LOC112876760 n=1 Tax=Panicum hallii TaxID=206008 RepID=UPI000DF4DE66|nr:uncharacterized protein LOC112876760 [Panicum hallii]
MDGGSKVSEDADLVGEMKDLSLPREKKITFSVGSCATSANVHDVSKIRTSHRCLAAVSSVPLGFLVAAPHPSAAARHFLFLATARRCQLADSDDEDFRSCIIATLTDRNSELKAKLNEVESEAQLNENNVEHQQSGPSLPFSNTPSVQNVCYSNFCRN